jgi:hypothetical protein
MTERAKIQMLVALLIVAGGLFFYERGEGPSTLGTASADTHFVPLPVQEPALRIDLLNNLQKDDYTGTHRNIFIAGAVPSASGVPVVVEAPRPFVGPQQPPPPPPLQVSVEFYGVESTVGGKQVALFKNGDDPPILVTEGETFMNRYRLVHIGNQSAEVEEIASGRHATVPQVQPQDQGPTGPSNGPSNGFPGGPPN